MGSPPPFSCWPPRRSLSGHPGARAALLSARRRRRAPCKAASSLALALCGAAPRVLVRRARRGSADSVARRRARHLDRSVHPRHRDLAARGPRAAGRQAIELAGVSPPAYHYASYVLPAVFAWPLDLSGLTLATSVWVPLGFLTACAGAYALGAALPGTAAAWRPAALTLLPDAASYGLHNRLFGYYWYVVAVPGVLRHRRRSVASLSSNAGRTARAPRRSLAPACSRGAC